LIAAMGCHFKQLKSLDIRLGTATPSKTPYLGYKKGSQSSDDHVPLNGPDWSRTNDLVLIRPFKETVEKAQKPLNFQ